MKIEKITDKATQDDLSDQDYREIYDELRENTSLDKFIAKIGSAFSKALWSKYENGQAELNRAMRNELRLAMNLAPLPPTISEAVSGVNPDATVYQIGSDQPDKIFLIGTDEKFLFDGSDGSIKKFPVTAVTPPTRARRRLIRPIASADQNQRRLKVLSTWQEVIDAGLRALEDQLQARTKQ